MYANADAAIPKKKRKDCEEDSSSDEEESGGKADVDYGWNCVGCRRQNPESRRKCYSCKSNRPPSAAVLMAAKEAKEAAKEAKEVAKAQEKRAKTPPPIADRLTFQTAIVPEGAKEGEVFYVVLQDGQPFGVACPAGAIPGQRIVVLPPKQHHRPLVRPSKISKMNRNRRKKQRRRRKPQKRKRKYFGVRRRPANIRNYLSRKCSVHRSKSKVKKPQRARKH